MKFKLTLLAVLCVISMTACSASEAASSSVSTPAVQSVSISESESTSNSASESTSECIECEEAKANQDEVTKPAVSGPEDVSFETFSQKYPLTSEDGKVNVVSNSFKSNLWENPNNVKDDAEYYVDMWRYQLFPDAQNKIESILGNYYSDNSIMQYDAYLNQYLFSMQLASDPLGYAGAYSSGGKGVTAYWVFNPDDRDAMVKTLESYDKFLQENFYNSEESELDALMKSKAFYNVLGDRAIYVLPFALRNLEDTDKEYTIEEYSDIIDQYVTELCDSLGFPYPDYINSTSTSTPTSTSTSESTSASTSTTTSDSTSAFESKAESVSQK